MDFGYYFFIVVTVVAISLLAMSAMHDVAFRTLPNWVSAALLLCGLFMHLTAGRLPAAGLTALTVFAASSAAWRLGWLGGGDAKLLGAASFVTMPERTPTLLLGTALAGGVLAFLFLALRPLMPAPAPERPSRLFARVLRAELWRIRRRGPLPYGVAIAVGGAWALLAG